MNPVQSPADSKITSSAPALANAPSRDYDSIVIGSGIGGLTTASILAQVGKQRVLVLERHFKLGGFTHAFRRKKYEWDAGVHYVGEMHEKALSRKVMDLVTGGEVEWHKMGDTLERYIFPEDTFDVPSDRESFETRLIERFPDEDTAIRKYFRDIKRAQGWMQRWFTMKQYPQWMSLPVLLFGKSLPGRTTREYMEQQFRSPVLRAILTAQWPDFGAPPDKSAFGWHATVSGDFFNGGYYPIGGAKVLADSAAKMIRQHGGECLVNHSATRIVVRNGRAVGVEAVNGEEHITFNAPRIISNAGGAVTFGNLLPSTVPAPERKQAARIEYGPSSLILFLGLNDDPRKHGFEDVNYWMYSRLDHDAEARYREGEPDRLDGAFLSFGSLRNPGQEPHTAQIVTFTKESDWQEFSGSRWKNRGEKYETRKRAVEEQMIQYVEDRLPGFRKLISYQELSTPHTVKSFTGHKGGMIYGQLCDHNRLFRDRWNAGTSVPGLYLTGSDVGSPGVNGALFGGLMSAGKVMGLLGFPRIMTKVMTA